MHCLSLSVPCVTSGKRHSRRTHQHRSSHERFLDFLGWFTQLGGIWTGDYLVAEYAPFQTNPDLSYGKVRQITHRVKEVDVYLTNDGKFKFPLAERKDALARLPPGTILEPH
jgi:hypothetical protein